MTKFILSAHQIVWGIPTLLLILITGLVLLFRTRFLPLRLLPRGLRLMARSLRSHGDGSFQAMCTALAATVGTGNLVGVAGALCLGGPGAIFWMWLCGILGMVTKFAEVTLAQRFRVTRSGESFGGPMYIITRGMGPKWHFLAVIYCILGLIASFGVGNAAQVQAVVASVRWVFPALTQRQTLGLGIAMAVLLGIALFGGQRTIGAAAEKLIPFAAGGYILLCFLVLALRRQYLADAFSQILLGAFSPRAVTGGVVGSFFQALRTGCSRGVFTNEAGMGTASIAHAGADVPHPVHQGLLGVVEVFLDTIVICTLTALVILVSGIPIPYGTDAGMTLTGGAFSQVLGGWTAWFLAAALTCFAVGSVLGWGLYGGRCAQFLFGERAWVPFAAAQTAAIVFAVIQEAQVVWLLSEIFNGLMALPNLVALAALAKEVSRLSRDYERKSGGPIHRRR